MILSAFVEVLLPVLVVVGCGYALRRVFPIDLRSLNRINMYVLSPALIFTTLARIEVAGVDAGDCADRRDHLYLRPAPAPGSGRPLRAAAFDAE